MHLKHLLISATLVTGTILAQSTPTLPSCTSHQLSLATDARNGCFNGMSHSGTMIVLRNTSSTACTLDPFPHLAFEDKQHHPLHLQLTPETPFQSPHTPDTPRTPGKPLSMGHGPVAQPLPVPPGAEATLALRWVAGEVYDHSVCVEPARLLVTSGHTTRSVPLRGHLCGPDANHLEITFTRLTTAPNDQPCH